MAEKWTRDNRVQRMVETQWFGFIRETYESFPRPKGGWPHELTRFLRILNGEPEPTPPPPPVVALHDYVQVGWEFVPRFSTDALTAELARRELARREKESGVTWTGPDLTNSSISNITPKTFGISDLTQTERRKADRRKPYDAMLSPKKRKKAR